MSLQHGILGLLMYNKMSGYNLVKLFESSLGLFWYAQSSHVYLELKKLEKAKFISSELIVQENKPNKSIYEITAEGKEAFYTWLSNDEYALNKIKNEFLMSVFFAGNLSPKESKKKLEVFIEEVQEHSNSLAKGNKFLEDKKSSQSKLDALHWQFTADFGQKYIAMRIDWAKDCIKQLEEFEKNNI